MFHPKGPTLVELARQALSSTDRGYDLLASKFEYTPFRTPEPVLSAAFRVAREGGPVARGCDLCCGTGAALAHLRALCADEAAGLDRSQGMLDEAARRLAEQPSTTRVTLRRGDALAPPADWLGRFDLVCSFGAFGHIEEPDEPRFVGAVSRLLAPGGRFLCVTADPPPRASSGYLLARGFNAAMRVRNALWSPPFVMYYLTFLLPRARALFEAEGFSVRAHRAALPAPYERYVVLEATKPA